MKRSRSAPGLQSASSGSRRVPIAYRPAVFRLVVLCEQALPDSRAAAGSAPSAARVCCDATPMAPAMGTPRRDGTEPEQPTDGAADPAVGVPTVRRDAPRSCSGTRPRPRPHRGPQRGAAQNPALVWRRGWPTLSNFSRLGAAQCRLSVRLRRNRGSTLNRSNSMAHCPCLCNNTQHLMRIRDRQL